MSRRVLTQDSNVKHRIHVVFDHQSVCSSQPHPADRASSLMPLTENEPLKTCLDKLDRLVGLEQVKQFVREIYAWLEINKRRQAVGLQTEQQVLHMVFTGNPGTGKTTVARILSELFKEMGVLSKGHLVEVERADLVGEYIGHTAQKTREHIKRSLGGILFIDEAYSLSRGGEKDFGKEAIDTIVKSMEDYRTNFILILAGYSNEMEQFLRQNPGLPSRFPIQLHFPNFEIGELIEIAEQMVQTREYQFTYSAIEKLRRHLLQKMDEEEQSFGNARYVRNLIEQAIRHQAVRLLDVPLANKEELMMIRGNDFLFPPPKKKQDIYSWYN